MPSAQRRVRRRVVGMRPKVSRMGGALGRIKSAFFGPRFV